MGIFGNDVPERLINFRVYYGGIEDYLGIATVELPEIEAMSDTVSGAGIAGEVDSPTKGHFGPMSVKFTWRTLETRAMVLAQQMAHPVMIRGSQQYYDAALGIYKSKAIVVSLRIVPKTVSLGSFEPSSTTDTEQEFEVLFMNVLIDNIPVVTIDKYNFIAQFGVQDTLLSVRKDLGM